MAQESTSSYRSVPRKGGSTLLERSCHDCNRRKVRCNKAFPCENCVRLGVECTFPLPGRKSRKTQQRPSNKAELVSRLSLLEREVQKLGGQSQPRPTSADLLEVQDRPKCPESSGTVRSWLANNVAADQPTDTEEHDCRTHEGLESPSVTTSGTLEEQFGRLVVDRNNGTSRYLSHRFLADLADQVNQAPHKSNICGLEQAC